MALFYFVSLINFVNIKQSAITVFVRKAQSTKAFDIPAREWYGEGNVPEYLNDFEKKWSSYSKSDSSSITKEVNQLRLIITLEYLLKNSKLVYLLN